MTDEREPPAEKNIKMNRRTVIAFAVIIIAGMALAYALLLHPSCAKRNTYVPELNGCVLQRVACKGLFCSQQEDQNLSCGERANTCGAEVACGCTDDDTTDWE